MEMDLDTEEELELATEIGDDLPAELARPLQFIGPQRE